MASLAAGPADLAPPPAKRQRVANGNVATSPTEEQESVSFPQNPRKNTTTTTPSLWNAAMVTELRRYVSAPDPETEGAYRPGPISKEQLIKAANEFVKRCDEANDDDEYVPLVLVSQKCKDIPSREFELDALQSIHSVSKLWYALTKDKDLFIIKYASDGTHGAAVSELGRCIGNFGIQFGNRGSRVFSWITDGKTALVNGTIVAADAVLQLRYPVQGTTPPQLRSPFVAELEYHNRTPKALLLQLDTYLLQQVADYVLGIKVYKRSGPQLPVGTNRPFSAIALLWRRGAALPGGMATLEGVWSFGTQALHMNSRRAFCVQRGNLQQVAPAQIVHPPAHTVASDAITIPKAHLLQGVVDENGAQVPIRHTDQDLTIDLGEIRGFFDEYLPL
jgi:hypothetical protein